MITPEGDDWADNIIRRTLALLARLPRRSVSQETERVYMNTMKRMSAEGFDPLRPGDARDTYGVRRAALHYRTRTMLLLELSRYRSARLSGDHAEMQRCLETLAVTLQSTEDAIERDPPLRQGAASFDVAASRWREQLTPPRRGKASKKHVLKELPADWMERLWSAAPKDWTHRDVLAVMMLAPVRPSEFVAGHREGRNVPGVGVDVRDGELLLAVVPSKSHNGKFGTGGSILRFDAGAANPVIAHLADLCRRKGGRVIVSLTSPNAMRKSLARLGRKALGKDAPVITPYVFRHQNIADLKATVGAGSAVAAAAGHSTDRTQAGYGRVERGRRRTDFLGAAGKRQPKSGHVARARELGESRRATPRSGPGL